VALQIGIVGLPNVGKSTLFNALTRSQKAAAANFPFCTIDPNVGVVEVPDDRLESLAEIVKPERVLPATVEFVDIAGLVKGAASGEGLGNKFLAHIRECDAIAQVVRVFSDDNVIHVHGDVSPKRDVEIIESELILADLETLTKRLGTAQGAAKTGDPKAKAYAALLESLKTHLEEGKLAFDFVTDDDRRAQLKDLHLLTNKPLLYIVNVSEAEVTADPESFREKLGIDPAKKIIPICAKIEEELGALSHEEAREFLTDMGMKEPGLKALIHAAYELLGYQTYFTAGVKEVRAWTMLKGDKAPQAAGVIHTDFEHGFIAAEVIGYDDFIACGGEQGAREKGKARIEGKEYVVRDGDVVHFRFNV